MAAPKFKINREDGTEEEVILRPRAQMAYESDTGKPLFDADEVVMMTKVYTLAWYAAGQPGTLEDFVDPLESVEMIDDSAEDDEELPTPAED